MYFLGLDIGTTGCKAGVYDHRGRILAKALVEYTIKIPKHGWAEQPAEMWWESAKRVIRQALEKARVMGKDIVALSISGQSPVIVPVDRHGNPLYHAIIWMDRRATKEAKEIEKITGIAEDPSWALPKILWIKRKLLKFTNVHTNSFRPLTILFLN